MRHGPSSACSAALLGLALSAGSASAQSRPGWVDPPARAVQPETTVKGQPDPEKAGEAAKPDQPRSEASAPDADGMAKRPEATPRRQASEPTMGSRRDTTRTAIRTGAPRPHRRLAQTPPLTPAAPPPGASEARFPEWASAAQRLTVDYLDSVSAPGGTMIAAAPRFYAERVNFHGRTLSLAALLAEKRRFVRRWPERRYEPQSGSLRTACSAQTATCVVHATFDFRAENPARGARSQGVSELVLTFAFRGERPVIVAETSRVLRRYGSGPLSAIAGSRRGA